MTVQKLYELIVFELRSGDLDPQDEVRIQDWMKLESAETVTSRDAERYFCLR